MRGLSSFTFFGLSLLLAVPGIDGTPLKRDGVLPFKSSQTYSELQVEIARDNQAGVNLGSILGTLALPPAGGGGRPPIEEVIRLVDVEDAILTLPVYSTGTGTREYKRYTVAYNSTTKAYSSTSLWPNVVAAGLIQAGWPAEEGRSNILKPVPLKETWEAFRKETVMTLYDVQQNGTSVDEATFKKILLSRINLLIETKKTGCTKLKNNYTYVLSASALEEPTFFAFDPSIDGNRTDPYGWMDVPIADLRADIALVYGFANDRIQ